MNNSYLVSFADLDSQEVWIEKFQGRSFNEIQDKIKNYIESSWDWDEDIDFPNNYNEFKTELADKYNILIGKIEDLETL